MIVFRLFIYFCLAFSLFVGQEAQANFAFALVGKRNNESEERNRPAEVAGLVVLHSNGDYKYELPLIDFLDSENYLNYLRALGLEDDQDNRDEYDRRCVEEQIGCQVNGPFWNDLLDSRFIVFSIDSSQQPEKGIILSVEEALDMCNKGKINQEYISNIIMFVEP
ncbi:MAG: hypothetical protein LBI37_01200 [Puniceicoccales bacterium]|jgi:hypothetical protein|nr:hypothetical protein [Puniceicoccales bacterium]